MIEQAYNSIISAGAVAIILTAGIIFMYRHFMAEVKELKAQLSKKDEEINAIVRENIALQTRILDALKMLTHEK